MKNAAPNAPDFWVPVNHFINVFEDSKLYSLQVKAIVNPRVKRIKDLISDLTSDL